MTDSTDISFLETVAVIVAAAVCVEILFYAIVRLCLIPRANKRLPPPPYRDYKGQGDRHRLLLRILERIERNARSNNKPVNGAIANTILGWFRKEKSSYTDEVDKSLTPIDPINSPPSSPATDIESNSPSAAKSLIASTRLRFRGQAARGQDDIICENNTNTGEDESSDECGVENIVTNPDGTWTIKGLRLADVSKLFAWVLFSKDIEDLESWEKEELNRGFKLGEERLGLVFRDNDEDQEKEPIEQQQPLLMSLEDVTVSHKLLSIYVLVYIVKFVTGAVLRCLGFRRIVTRTGLVAWFRPAQKSKEEEQELIQLQPLLFFHGVSPAPLAIVLPMILNGLATDRRRAVVLFENPTISWSLSFHALSEEDTVAGVKQIVDEYLDSDKNEKQRFIIAGHSFGACCITWLVLSPTSRSRIGQIILLDPVTILLSEPSVVVNFLYANRGRANLLEIVSTELFTQYYLRRHFSWYNSELWLEDVPSEVPLTIALSGKDDIVDAPSVRDFILQFQQDNTNRQGAIQLLYWPTLPHAACVLFPDHWRQVEQAMLQQEMSVVHPKQILPEVSSTVC